MLFSSSFIYPQSTSTCVLLEQCAPLLVLWESRYIQANTAQALETLASAHCGFVEGSSSVPVFRCPDQESSNEDVVISRHVIDAGVIRSNRCSGSLKLFNGVEAEPEVVTRESMRRMRAVVDRALVVGNCCWRIFKKNQFRGRSVTVASGQERSRIGIVKSIQKLDECPMFV